MLPPERQEEKEPADWGEVFTTFLVHTGMSYEEIAERTIPQVEAVLERIGKHVCLRAGVPVKDEGSVNVEPEEEHTVEQGMAFATLFAGIG